MGMRINRIGQIFLFLPLCLLMGAILLTGSGQEEAEFPLSVVWQTEGMSQTIRGIESDGSVLFCLPGCARPEELYLQLQRGSSCRTDGGEIWKDQDSLSESFFNQVYQVQITRGIANTEEYAIEFLQGSDIPSIFVTTASGSLEFVHEEKGNQESGFLQIADESGALDCSVGLKRISGRGNTSWDAEKKSYTLKLEDAKDVLGMGASKTWLLIANYYDGAYVRNQIGFEMAREGGILYTPDERFAELYVNGEYRGLYQIMEKLEAGVNRMEIGGCYLLELDQRQKVGDEEFFLLPNEQPVVIHDPETNRETDRVKGFFDSFSADMEAGNVPFDRLDMTSFAKTFVLEEILQDLDFGQTSHYMYLDLEGEMLYDGPPWDLDNTMGRGEVQEAEEWFAATYKLSSNNLTRWYAKLIAEPQFYRLVSEQYQENFRPVLKQLVETGIDERIDAIHASILMDQERYPGAHSSFMPDASLEENVAYLKNYLAQKMAVMDEIFDGDEAHMPQKADLPKLQESEY